MTRLRVALVLLLTAGLQAQENAGAPRFVHTLYGLLGGKALSRAWEPAEGQGVLGLHYDLRRADCPVAFAVGVLGSATEEEASDGRDLASSTSEFTVGIQTYWGHGRVPGFLGGGLALVGAAEERLVGLDIVDDDGGAADSTPRPGSSA